MSRGDEGKHDVEMNGKEIIPNKDQPLSTTDKLKEFLWCFEPGLPLTISNDHKNSKLSKWIQYEYARFRQADDFLQYWPIITAFLLGVLGAVQSYVSNDDNSLTIAKAFGLAQAITGLSVTFAAGIAGIRRDVAEKRLKDYIVDAMNQAGFFNDSELKTAEVVFQRIGIKQTEASISKPSPPASSTHTSTYHH